MNAMTGHVPVTAVPFIDPERRSEFSLPAGMTVAEMVDIAVPDLSDSQRGRTRVTLVSNQGQAAVPAERWHRVRPHPGIRLVIRIVPGKTGLRSLLLAVVSVAAAAVGQVWLGPALSGALGFTAGSIGAGLVTSGLTLGLTAVGGLLINALVPPQQRDDGSYSEKPNYLISGWRNAYSPDGAVPAVAGTHRFAPPFAAPTWTEIVGDDLFVRALFLIGYGEVVTSDYRIGDTPIDDFADVQMEIRDGLDSDTPIELVPQQVLEEAVNADLLKKNDPQTRYTAGDITAFAVLLSFPAGLVTYDNKGRAVSVTVKVRVRYRPVGDLDWTDTTTLSIKGGSPKALYRSHYVNLPSRGRYEVEVHRTSDDADDNQTADRCMYLALQSIRPEYPVNFDQPLALIAARVRASAQLNGTLDNFNCLAKRVCLDWDSGSQTWIKRATRNPASIYRWMLQSPAARRPVNDAEIDLVALADWHEFCVLHDLKYDRIHDFEGGWDEALAAITAAGRATPRNDGTKWTVVIDRPQSLEIDHISPRNSRNFNWQRNYIDPPDAFRVPFLDETNNHQSAERIVPWPGLVGDIDVTEQLDLPGKTDPNEIYLEARRRQYELIYRPETFTVVQDGSVRVATRGDLVVGSFDQLETTHKSAAVQRITGNLITLDDLITMEDGKTYAIRFHKYSVEDTVGTSIVRAVETRSGEHDTVKVTGSGEMPAPKTLVHFGPAATVSMPLRVRATEGGEDLSTVFHLIPDGEEIDTLIDAEVPPAWSGRVGDEAAASAAVPDVPVFLSIVSGFAGTGDVDGLEVRLRAGYSGSAIVRDFNIRHRLSGAGSWTTITIPAADGGTAIVGYSAGDVVEISANAVSITDIPGNFTDTETETIGAEDSALPVALPAETISATAALGSATLVFGTSADAALHQVQVYANAGAALDRDTDALGSPMLVEGGSTYQRIDGDATRTNMLSNPDYASDTIWVKGVGWTIAAGEAAKAAGTASDLSQAQSLNVGDTYRYGGTMSGRTAGALTPKLTGGTDVPGSAVSADGDFAGAVTAVTGNTDWAFAADATFDGSLDDAILYLETASTLPQGTRHYWLEPQNEDGAPGPIAGPFVVTII